MMFRAVSYTTRTCSNICRKNMSQVISSNISRASTTLFSRYLSTSGTKDYSERLATITTKPTTPEEIETYNKLLENDAIRDAIQAEDAAARRLLQDEVDGTVFHASPNNAKEINIQMNPDGSFTFSSESGNSATTTPTKNEETPVEPEEEEEASLKMDDPRMIIGMTCGECDTRLVKSMPKRSYEKGVVLIRCDGCNNSHLIADHLGWFDDGGINIEMIMKEQGQNVVRVDANNSEAQYDQATRDLIQQTLDKANENDLKASVVDGKVPEVKSLA